MRVTCSFTDDTLLLLFAVPQGGQQAPKPQIPKQGDNALQYSPIATPKAPEDLKYTVKTVTIYPAEH